MSEYNLETYPGITDFNPPLWQTAAVTVLPALCDLFWAFLAIQTHYWILHSLAHSQDHDGIISSAPWFTYRKSLGSTSYWCVGVPGQSLLRLPKILNRSILPLSATHCPPPSKEII